MPCEQTGADEGAHDHIWPKQSTIRKSGLSNRLKIQACEYLCDWCGYNASTGKGVDAVTANRPNADSASSAASTSNHKQDNQQYSSSDNIQQRNRKRSRNQNIKFAKGERERELSDAEKLLEHVLEIHFKGTWMGPKVGLWEDGRAKR